MIKTIQFMKKLLIALLASLNLLSIPISSANTQTNTTTQPRGISIIPEVQENFRSNYSCTIIMKEFEQLYDFGYVSTVQEAKNQINEIDEELKIINHEGIHGQNQTNQQKIQELQSRKTNLSQEILTAPTKKFTCATKDLNNYLTTDNWVKKACDPNTPTEASDFRENDILGCSIITGRIRFAYVPRFIVYALELLTILSGVLSLLFVILGGYYYLINSLSGGDMDKGKSYIKNAVIGLIVSLSAWSVINLVQLFFTS